MTQPLLSLDNLEVTFRTETGDVTPVRGVTFDVHANETLAIVGESGSGKSVSSLAVMGLLPKGSGRVSAGSIRFRTRSGAVIDLAKPDGTGKSAQSALRGREIAMIFQEPMTSLNPVLTVGEQIAEAVRLHLGYDRRKAWDHAVKMLSLVEIPDAGRRAADYPHHMSGGMRQRVMIALAMSCSPALLIADEPTTALDVTIQAQVLHLINRLRQDNGMGVMFITHNLGVVAEIAQRVAVMYAGEVVENAPVRDLFHAPRHPYTRALLECLPARAALGADGRRMVRAIPGQVSRVEKGCAFAARCSHAAPECHQTTPVLETDRNRSVRCLRWRQIG